MISIPHFLLLLSVCCCLLKSGSSCEDCTDSTGFSWTTLSPITDAGTTESLWTISSEDNHQNTRFRTEDEPYPEHSASQNYLNLLHNKLLPNYNIQMPPYPVGVAVQLRPMFVLKMDERKGKATVFFHILLDWTDTRLANRSSIGTSYANLSTHISLSDVWYPPIRFFDVLDYVDNLYPQYPIRLYQSGKLNLKYSVWVSVFVKFEDGLVQFPFDSHEIFLVLSHVTLATPGEINLTLNSEKEKELMCIPEWSVIKYRINRHEGILYGEPFTAIVAVIKMQRKPDSYIINFCLPCFFVVILAVIGIHSAGKNKFHIGLMSLIALATISLAITNSLPKSSVITRLHKFYFGMVGGIITSCIVSFGTFCNGSGVEGPRTPRSGKPKKRFRKFADILSVIVHILYLLLLLTWYYWFAEEAKT